MRKITAFGFSVLIFLAIAASLRPFEPFMLGFGCISAALVALAILPMVQSRAQIYLGVATAAVLLSIAFTNWPLHLAYGVSASSFDSAAKQIRAGESISTPCFVGAFRIAKAEVYSNGVICFWTDTHPSGQTGFAQCGPQNPPFNLWSHTRLDESWQFISED